jgi:SAM-dependent methyltransferase
LQRESNDESVLDPGHLWDQYWTGKSVEEELAACELECRVGDILLSYVAKGDRIIEAGCGLGKWVVFLRQRGHQVLGLDSNHPTLGKLLEFDGAIELELGDVLHLPHPESCFDVYISVGVVEHFEEGPWSALREAHRVVRPNGLIFVSVPTVNVLRRFITPSLRRLVNCIVFSLMAILPPWSLSKVRTAATWWYLVLPLAVRGRMQGSKIRMHFTEYRYSRAEVERFLSKCGFEVVKAIPHDCHGAKDHSAGLWGDFPFLRGPGANYKLNWAGGVVSRLLDKVSPWIACSSVMVVARCRKAA